MLLADHLFDLAFALGVLWYAAALGRTVARPLAHLADGPADGLATLGLGLGALSLSILSAGFLRLYYATDFLAGWIALTIWLRHELRATLIAVAGGVAAWLRAGMPSAPDRGQRLVIAVLALALAPLWVDSMLPAGAGSLMEWDAPAYHLAAPKLYIAAHSIIPLRDIPLANAPSGEEMLFLAGLLGGADNLGRTLNVLFAVLLAVATYTCARRHFGARAGWLSIPLVCNVPWLVTEVPATLNDLAAAFLLVIGVSDAFAALDRRQGDRCAPPRTEAGAPAVLQRVMDRSGRLVLRSGLLIGSAVSYKLVNIPAIPALLATIAIAGAYNVRGKTRDRLLAALVGCSLFSCGALIALGPWLLKNLVFFADPLYPVVVGATQQATSGGAAATTQPALLTRLWWLATNLAGVCWHATGPLSLALLATPFILRRRIDRIVLCSFLLSGVLWLWFVPQYGDPRYYIAWIALAAILCAATIDRLLTVTIRARVVLSTFIRLVITGYLFVNSLLMLGLGITQMLRDQAPRVAIGAVSRYDYLAAHVAPYLAEQYANRHTPPNAEIALVHTTLGYYLDRPHLGDWYSARRLRLERAGAARRRELAAWCRAGVRYAIFNRGDDHDAAFNLPMPVSTAWLRTPGLHPRLLFSANDVDVFALQPCAAAHGGH